MSKSNQRYGATLYVARVRTEADVKPSQKLLHEWAQLDAVAQKEFGRKYDLLTSKQKSDLHFVHQGRQIQGTQGYPWKSII